LASRCAGAFLASAKRDLSRRLPGVGRFASARSTGPRDGDRLQRLIFDRFAADEDRPVFMFFLLAVLMLPFGLTGLISSSAGALALFSGACS
jgi:hypothetical protein